MTGVIEQFNQLIGNMKVMAATAGTAFGTWIVDNIEPLSELFSQAIVNVSAFFALVLTIIMIRKARIEQRLAEMRIEQIRRDLEDPNKQEN